MAGGWQVKQMLPQSVITIRKHAAVVILMWLEINAEKLGFLLFHIILVTIFVKILLMIYFLKWNFVTALLVAAGRNN